jgi:tryptophan-rich sensory protein
VYQSEGTPLLVNRPPRAKAPKLTTKNIITLLTLLMGYFLLNYWPVLKIYSLLVLPYVLWLIIATSLNGYILLKN